METLEISREEISMTNTEKQNCKQEEHKDETVEGTIHQWTKICVSQN